MTLPEVVPRPLRARWLLPFVAVAVGFALWQGTRGLHWRELRPGVEFTSLSGDPYCRLGSSAVAVLRFDPHRIRLRVHHYSHEGAERPPSIIEWQRATGALAVFNAGQYYPNWKYMGLLVSGGDTISSRTHAGYQAALVARGSAKNFAARIVDLSRSRLTPRSGWTDVAQSFMLFDRAGVLRVRHSQRIANRTIVAEDRRGRLVVLVTEGSYTLAEFATLLQRSPLQLTQAMSMDGGIESELVVQSGSFRYASFGRWLREHEPDAPGARVPLPAVITLAAE